jgi:hypothetical protein
LPHSFTHPIFFGASLCQSDSYSQPFVFRFLASHSQISHTQVGEAEADQEVVVEREVQEAEAVVALAVVFREAVAVVEP